MAQKYKRQMTEEELRDEMIERGEMDEDGNLLSPDEDDEVEKSEKKMSDDSIDWKKRHDDGRRYQLQLQSTNKELEEQVRGLKEELKNKASVPENMEEFEDWVKEYPKVADMMKIIARQEAASLDENFKTKLSKLDEIDQKERLQREKLRLQELQPDFYSNIARSDEFRQWIENAPEWKRKALAEEKNPDADIVSTIIDSFKQQTGYGQKKPKTDKKTTDEDIASSVSTRSKSAPKDQQKNVWSESRLERLTDQEYEKYEDEIDEAIRNGTFVRDISDAQ